MNSKILFDVNYTFKSFHPPFSVLVGGNESHHNLQYCRDTQYKKETRV